MQYRLRLLCLRQRQLPVQAARHVQPGHRGPGHDDARADHNHDDLHDDLHDHNVDPDGSDGSDW